MGSWTARLICALALLEFLEDMPICPKPYYEVEAVISQRFIEWQLWVKKQAWNPHFVERPPTVPIVPGRLRPPKVALQKLWLSTSTTTEAPPSPTSETGAGDATASGGANNSSSSATQVKGQSSPYGSSYSSSYRGHSGRYGYGRQGPMPIPPPPPLPYGRFQRPGYGYRNGI